MHTVCEPLPPSSLVIRGVYLFTCPFEPKQTIRQAPEASEVDKRPPSVRGALVHLACEEGRGCEAYMHHVQHIQHRQQMQHLQHVQQRHHVQHVQHAQHMQHTQHMQHAQQPEDMQRMQFMQHMQNL